MGVPFLLHEDHLDVSPTRSTFSFGSFSGIGDDRRGIERGGWQTTILGEILLSLPQVLCHSCPEHSQNNRGSLFLHPSYCHLCSWLCLQHYTPVRRNGNCANSRPWITYVIVHFFSENYHLYWNNNYGSSLQSCLYHFNTLCLSGSKHCTTAA